MSRELLKEDAVFPVREDELALAIDADATTVYWLRPITVEQARRIRKMYTKPIPNRRTHQMEDQVDFEGLQDAFIDYCLVKWEGVTSDGKDAPCTPEMKRALPPVVQAALVERASIGEGAAQRAASFRQPA